MGAKNEMEETLFEAFQLEQSGEWKQAISLYEQVLEKWGDRPEADYARNAVTRLRERLNASSRSIAQSQIESQVGDKPVSRSRIKGSIVGAVALLIWDAAISGSYLTSILVCPIWFLVSLLKNAIQRP